MNDAEYEAQQARVLALVTRWKPIIAPDWRVDVHYARGYFEHAGEVTPGCVAAVTHRWGYMEAGITFDLQECAGATDENLTRYVVHELCHLLIAELMESTSLEVLYSRKEHATSTITRAILDAAAEPPEAGAEESDAA